MRQFAVWPSSVALAKSRKSSCKVRRQKRAGTKQMLIEGERGWASSHFKANTMVSRSHRFIAFLALFLVVHSVSHRHLLAEAAPSEPYLYFVYYEDDAASFSSSQCQANPVGLKGYASGDETVVLGGSGDSCAQEVACQIDVNSNQCQKELSRTVSGTAVTIITDTGEIQECDSTNFEIGSPECLFFAGCEESSAYPHCNFDIVKTSDLQSNPEMLTNDDDLSDLEDYAYLVYYSDSSCTNIAGVKGAVSDTTFEIPRQGRDVSCLDAMACILQPEGSTCQTIRAVRNDLGMTKTRVQTRGDQVYECDSSNEQLGEPTCAVLDPEPCRASSTIANCHFRWLSAQDLAQHPRRLVGDFSNKEPFNTSAGSFLVGGGVTMVTMMMVQIVGTFFVAL